MGGIPMAHRMAHGGGSLFLTHEGKTLFWEYFSLEIPGEAFIRNARKVHTSARATVILHLSSSYDVSCYYVSSSCYVKHWLS